MTGTVVAVEVGPVAPHLPTRAEWNANLSRLGFAFSAETAGPGVRAVTYRHTGDGDPNEAADEFVAAMNDLGWFTRWSGYADDPIYVAVRP